MTYECPECGTWFDVNGPVRREFPRPTAARTCPICQRAIWDYEDARDEARQP